MTITQELARNVHSIFVRELPAEAMQKAKLAILDTFGVALAGSCHDGAAKLRNVVLPGAGSGPAAVFGTSYRLNVLDAALLNGTSAHMLDYDDSNSQLHGHPSVAILPGLLAIADQTGASGSDLMRAYIAGFEVATRIGSSTGRHQYTHGWHPTATVGIFAGVGAASVLAGLSEDQTAMAFGIAASMASGIKSNFGSMTKPLHVGQAGRNGLLAVQLAREGFTSNPNAFDHHHGYLNVFDRGPENYDAAKLVSGWGEPLGILDWGIKQKRFPCCYACLPPSDGMLDLMARFGLKPDEVHSIEVAVHAIRFPHINNPSPRSPLEAKFSVHYCLARILLAGALRIEDFEGDGYKDPATRRLMQRVSFSAYAHDNIGGAEVRVRTTDGRVLESQIEAALGGSYKNPLPDDVVRQKFEDCAGRVLSGRQTRLLYDRLRELEAVCVITDLTDLIMVPHAAKQAASG
jgi:2-methylcitrate dehydratase PrpD